MLRTPERKRSDGGSRVHAARSRPNAAVVNEKIRHVMTTAPGVNHGSGRIDSHLARTENMPSGFADERRDDHFARARRFERFLRAGEMKFQQPLRVLRHAIDK